MGHANVSNLSKTFVRQLYAKGSVTIGQVADVCATRGETLHASEGEYEDRYMLCVGLEDVVCFLLDEKAIEPAAMTPEQESVFQQWREGDIDDWDCGDDGEGGQYGILDGILFRFAPGQRKRYADIPMLSHITH